MAANFANPNYLDQDVNMVMGIYNVIEDTLEMARRDAEAARQEREASRRSLLKWIKIFVFTLFTLSLLTYVSILAYHHMMHPRPNNGTPFLSSPPSCNGETRTLNVSGLREDFYPNLLHFNYVKKDYPTFPAAYLKRGEAILSVNGEDTRGNHSDVMWDLLEAPWEPTSVMVVQNCTDALNMLQNCEAKYEALDEYKAGDHYPYRYVDLLQRCEDEGFDVTVQSNMFGDIWRGVMYFIHEHQEWFPTTHKKAYMS